MSETPEYDTTVLDQLAASIGQDGAVEVVESLISDAPELLDGLRAALETGDAKRAQRHAHTMKSNSWIVGAKHLGELCAEVERVAASGEPIGSAELLAATALETYECLVRDLRQWLQS
jgi:histidine phosphotransfer protein HptB